MPENNPKTKFTPYEKLKSIILAGELIPGTRVTEAFVADKLEVSRIPAREAIQQLCQEGLIDRNEKNGFQITSYDEQDIIDLYTYREALDGMLVRLFTLRADSSQIFYLEILVDNLKLILEKGDLPALMKNDIEFHRTIARGSKNTYMQKQSEILLERVIYIAQTLMRIGEESITEYHDIAHYEEIYAEHFRILDAIRKHDPDLAERAARESLQAGLKKTLLSLAFKRQLM